MLLTLLLSSCMALAADAYQQGKIVKWENGTYAENNKKKPMKNWIIYQLQTDNSTYSIARQKETKPQMQAGEPSSTSLRRTTRSRIMRRREEARIPDRRANGRAGTMKPSSFLTLTSDQLHSVPAAGSHLS